MTRRSPVLPLVALLCAIPSVPCLARPFQDPKVSGLDAEALLAGFDDPPARARPDAFWAWLNGHADPARITEEMEAFKAMGFARLQVWDVRAHRDPDGVVPVGPAFLSDPWLENFAHAEKEARRVGLELGLVAASGWNAGGTWVNPSRAGLGIYGSTRVVEGGSALDVQLEFPEVPEHAPRAEDGRPALWATVAVQAVPAETQGARGEEVGFDPGSVIDLTSRIDQSGRLTVDLPDGPWELRWFIRANSGQHLIVPSPNSDGLQIDFFDADDSRWYFEYVLDRLEAAVGPLDESALRYLEVDSLELEGARLTAWTEDILSSFAARFDYDATPWLTLLLEPGRAGPRGERFLHDWTRHVSDLMVENHYRLGNEILTERGLLLSAEAGGPGPPIWNSCPVDALGALGATGMMRGEFWPKQRSMYNVKEIACAAHTYGHRIVDAESFTSWRHWRDLPYYLKLLADQAFLDGLNHITFHTAPHGGAEQGLPGYAYHAGTHIGPNLVWWPMAGPFIEYLSRCSFMLQEGVPVADVCFYQGAGAPVFHPLGVDWDPVVRELGFDYDVVDVRQLVHAMRVEDGRLRLPGGVSYRYLVLPATDGIDLAALRRVAELVREGATVIGHRPVRAAGLARAEEADAEVERLTSELWGDPGRDAVGVRTVGEGTVISGVELEDVLRVERADVTWEGGDERTRLGFVHRRTGDTDIYFVVNHNERYEAVEGLFRVEGAAPEFWDPATGEVEPLAWEPAAPECTRVGLTLPPGGAGFVVFRRSELVPPETGVDLPSIERAAHGGPDLAHGDAPNGPHWLSSGENPPANEFVSYDLGEMVRLGGLEVSNFQDKARGLLTRGVRSFTLSTSTDGTTFEPVGEFELRRAPDIGERDCEQRLSFEPTEARYVRLDVIENHSDDWSGHTRIVGLNRVRFLVDESEPVPGVRVHEVSSGTAFDPCTDDLCMRVEPGTIVEGPWAVRFESHSGAPIEVEWETLRSWTDAGTAEIEHFSGIAEYTTRFEVASEDVCAGASFELDLGRLAGVARVHLNGRDLGVLWTPPYVVDVTGSLVAGENVLRCEVANTWHNRLVGDASAPESERTTVTNIRGPFGEQAPLLEAGILGPVRWRMFAPGTDGWRRDLPNARLFVPSAAEVRARERAKGGDAVVQIPLYMHFQGGPDTAEANFLDMGRDGVLIASTLSGFSSAFREPYEDPEALDALLSAGEVALGDRIGGTVRFAPITITFFSAGYGAVREFLKEPRHFDRIECLVSADSIYADAAAPGVRAPRVDQMEGFLRFAQAAARGEKTFVVVHGMIATEYVSTAECADLLLASVAGERAPARWKTERGVDIEAECHIGGFHLLSSSKDDAKIHVECLRMIPELVRRYAGD